MSVPTLDGVTAKEVTTDRITTRVLFTGPEDGVPVLFLHGNASSATWWEENMVALPPGYRGIAPDQRGFGDADPDQKVDATRGPGDWADDAVALFDVIHSLDRPSLLKALAAVTDPGALYLADTDQIMSGKGLARYRNQAPARLQPHRVVGSGHPLPTPTERSVPISGTTLFRG